MMRPASKRRGIADSTIASYENQTSFLDSITIEHGPRALLGRLFLKAASCAEARGVRLRVCTLVELEAFFHDRMKDWPTMPVFKPEYQPRKAGLSESFAILGEDGDGNIVATQAARFFDWSHTTLKSEVESMRMLYGENVPPTTASAEVAADQAGKISGRVVYSGSTWFSPEYRKRQLSAILPRISRCLALTKWNVDTTISFMDWRIIEKGVAARYGYNTLEASVTLRNVVDPEFVAAIGWITRNELIQDAEWFLGNFPIELPEGIETGRRNYAS